MAYTRFWEHAEVSLALGLQVVHVYVGLNTPPIKNHANPEGNGPQRSEERGRRGHTGKPQPQHHQHQLFDCCSSLQIGMLALVITAVLPKHPVATLTMRLHCSAACSISRDTCTVMTGRRTDSGAHQCIRAKAELCRVSFIPQHL